MPCVAKDILKYAGLDYLDPRLQQWITLCQFQPLTQQVQHLINVDSFRFTLRHHAHGQTQTASCLKLCLRITAVAVAALAIAPDRFH